MGTRADFYVGRGKDAEWLGSIAWDGYPAGVAEDILSSPTEQNYREQVSGFLAREDATTPDMGWPWPWDDSNTTDYAYAYDGGAVWACSFGHAWFEVNVLAECYGEPDDEADASPGHSQDFPDMSSRKATTFGARSGLIVFGGTS